MMRAEAVRNMVAEESLYIPGPAGRLYATVHRPAETPDAARGMVFCHPFADERRLSARVMVRMARVLAAAGVAVLRFDMTGCGDSEGSFAEATLGGWTRDAGAALGWLRDDLASDDVGLLGLRLGAAIAARAASADGRAPRLVMWAPVVSGAEGILRDLKRKKVRAMLTGGKAGGEKREGEEWPIDLDGWPVGREMFEELSGLDLAAEDMTLAGQALVVQISFRAKVESGVEKLAARLEEAGARTEVEAIRAEPFWNPLDLHDSPEVVAATLRHLAPGSEDALEVPA
jgi:exosortase A-associated hydrolase 2